MSQKPHAITTGLKGCALAYVMHEIKDASGEDTDCDEAGEIRILIGRITKVCTPDSKQYRQGWNIEAKFTADRGKRDASLSLSDWAPHELDKVNQWCILQKGCQV